MRVGHRVGAERLNRLEKRVERHAAEARAELRPLGHAMDVARHRLERKRLELFQGPLPRLGHHAIDPEAPIGGPDLRRWAGGENREAVLEVLTRGKSFRQVVRRAAASAESAGDELAHLDNSGADPTLRSLS